MGSLTPLIDQISLLVIGALLAIPGIYALYRGMHHDLEETNLRLQVESMGNEIQRLQVLTDDQARELARLRVEVGSLRAAQKGLVEMAKRLSQQVLQNGQVPIVDVENMGNWLP